MYLKNNQSILALCTILLIFASIAGCSGGGAKDIKIGAPMPLTGPFASDGEQMQRALELAIEEKNAAGGLLSRPLKLVPGDVGALEAEKIKAVGERLLGEKVDVLITGYADNGVDVRVFGEYDMPYLHADAMTASTELVAQNPKYKNCFQFCPSDVSYGRDIAANMFEIPAKMGWTSPNKKVAVIRADYSYNIAASDLFIKLAQEKGYEIVINEIVQFGTAEWGPILSKIKDLQPAYVTFWVLDPRDGASFTMQFVDKFSAEGINALIVMQYTPMYPEYLDIAGEKGNGVIFTTNIMPVGKGVEEFTAKFQKKFGEEPKSTYANITYDAFQIWVNAVEKVGCVDCYDKVNQAIRETKYQGMGGNYEFTSDDQQAKSGDDYIPSIWYQIQNQQRLMTFPDKYKETEYQLPPWIR